MTLRATLVAAALVAAGILSAAAVDAKTLRWSSQGDVLTMDPHSQNEGLNNTMSDHVYEPLVTRDKNLKLEPSLALSWQEVNPTTWRFKLRPDVRFHDGSPFNADDVVFSITRALEKTSDFSAYMVGVKGATKVDDLTVDINLNAPTPTLIDQLTEIRMMSRGWATKNNATKPQDFKNKEELYTSRNANGTGPFVLRVREPDVQTILIANSNWWGIKAGKREGNIDEVVYKPVKSDATRSAALQSGELDFVLDPPVQDIAKLKSGGIKILEGNENRTIFLNFDYARDELLYSNVKGKNPFRDVRVREAFMLAIDVDAIKTQVMRGLSTPTGSMIAPQVRGFSKAVDARPKVDLAKSRKLLADAGYAKGFEITLDCPNNRYIRDEAICQAIAAMLAKVDVKVKVNAMPRVNYFPKIQKSDSSFFLIGWGVPTFDSLYTLQSHLRTVGTGGDGNWNYGKYSNPKVDALIDRLKTESDFAKRAAITEEALKLHKAEVGHIPLHHQVIPWAMRSNVVTTHRADNRLHAKWTRVN
jgi:peptide/nickel transport system substrate-binding protein